MDAAEWSWALPSVTREFEGVALIGIKGVVVVLLRFIGALAVIGGCVGLGMYYAAKESYRANELLEFKKALLILSSEIEYLRSPLAVACQNIAKRTSSVVGNLFSTFAESLTIGEGETAYRLWVSAAETVKEASYMHNEDWDIIEGFGKTLGYLDKNMQQNAIDYAINYIDEKATELHLQGGKNKRMYRSLGVIGGLLVTVVLW